MPHLGWNRGWNTCWTLGFESRSELTPSRWKAKANLDGTPTKIHLGTAGVRQFLPYTSWKPLYLAFKACDVRLCRVVPCLPFPCCCGANGAVLEACLWASGGTFCDRPATLWKWKYLHLWLIVGVLGGLGACPHESDSEKTTTKTESYPQILRIFPLCVLYLYI